MNALWQRLRSMPGNEGASLSVADGAELVSRLRAELERCGSQAGPCSLVHVDVSGYSTVVQRYGWETGKALLSRIARGLREECGPADVLAQPRGSEFSLLLPGASAEVTSKVVGRIRRLYSDLSIGVVTWRGSDLPLQSIMQLAYQGMYMAQRSPVREHSHVIVTEGTAEPYVAHLQSPVPSS